MPNIKPRQVAGFFVYRHLGLLGCNIVLMKRFLPLFILTGLLFGQDLLLLKSGKFYKGVFIDKVDENIIFNIEGDSIHTEISIYNVDIIKTINGEYYYPFDIPTKKEEDNSEFWKRAAETRDRIFCCLILWLLISIVADPPM